MKPATRPEVIEQILDAAESGRKKPQIVERRAKLVYSDQYVSYWVFFDPVQGTTYGVRWSSREGAELKAKQLIESRRAEFKKELDKMTNEKLAEQWEFWCLKSRFQYRDLGRGKTAVYLDSDRIGIIKDRKLCFEFIPTDSADDRRIGTLKEEIKVAIEKAYLPQ